MRLELTRAFAAPPERVFAAFTDPIELAKWWGPRGFTTPALTLDVRVGGAYRLTMQPPEGDVFHLAGEYRTIEAPTRLEFTFRYEEPSPDDRETAVSLFLQTIPAGTRLSLSQGEFATEERLELHRAGWTDSFDRLQRIVE